MSAEHAKSGYPQVAIYRREGMLRHTIDCVPTRQPGVYLVNEPIDASNGEAVVIAFDGADLSKIHSFSELRASH